MNENSSEKASPQINKSNTELAGFQSSIWLKAFDIANQGIVVFSADEKVVACNEKAASLLGKTPKDIIGEKITNQDFDFIHEDGSKFKFTERFSISSLRSGQQFTHHVFGLIARDTQKTTWLNVTSVPELLAGQEKPFQVILILVDITQQRKYEASLNKRYKELSAIYSIANIADKDNLSLEELYQETIEMLPNSWQYPEITYGRITIDDKEYKTPNYQPTPWKQSAKIKIDLVSIGTLEIGYLKECPLEDEGPFLREERLLLDSIANRLGKIVQRRQLSENLRIKNQILELALQASQMGKWQQDFATNEILLDETARKHFGFTQGNITHTNLLDRIHPDDLEQVQSHYQDSIQSKHDLPIEEEFRVVHPNGSVKWLAVNKKIEYRKTNTGWQPIHVVGTTRDITEFKTITEAIKESEARFKLAQKIAHIGSWELNIKTGSLFWSDELFEINGIRPQEFIPSRRSFIETVHPEDREKISKSYTESLKTRRPYTIDYRLLLKDGTVKFVHEQCETIFDESGNPEKSFGTVQDVTEQKRSEEALRAINAKYQLIATNIEDVIWVLDVETKKFTYISPSVERLRGYTVEEVMKQPMDEVMTEDSIQRAFDGLDENIPLFIAGKPLKNPVIQVDQYHKNGSIIQTEVTTNLVFGENGRLQVIGVSRDIRERKKSEEILRQAIDKYYLIADNTDDLIFLMDLDKQTFSFVSPSCKKFTDYSMQEFLNLSLRDLLTKDSYEKAIEILSETKKRAITGQSLLPPTYEFEVVDKNGKVIPVEITSNLATDAAGLHQIVGITRDITERKRIDGEIKRSEARYRSTLDNMIEGCQIIDKEWRYIYVNDAVVQQSQYSREQLLGHTMMELYPGIEHTELVQKFKECKEKQTSIRFENVFQFPDGSTGSFDLSIQPVPEGIFVLSADITERKRAEEALERKTRALYVLSNCNQALVRIQNEQELLEEICRVVVEDGHYRMAWVGYAQEDEEKTVLPVAYRGHEEGFLSLSKITWADNERGQGPSGRVIRTNKPVITQKIADDPRQSAWHAGAIERGYASSISLPINVGGKTIGVIMFYASTPNAFQKEEIDLLTELSNDVSFGIETLRTRENKNQLEKELQISESRYCLAENSAHIGTWEIDLTTQEIFWSDEMYKLYGKDPNTVKPKLEKDIEEILPEDQEIIKKSIQKALAENLPINSEYRLRKADGHIIWLNSKGAVIRDESGKPTLITGTVQEITERKASEEAIKSAQEKTQAILDASHESVFLIDTQGKVISVNVMGALRLGTTPEHLTGNNLFSCFAPELAAIRKKQIQKVIETGKSSSFEDERAGHRFRTNAYPILDSNGKVKSIAIYATDISDQYRTQENLRQSESTLRAILNATIDAVYLIDPDGKVILSNATGAERYGCTLDSIKGKILYDLVNPELAKLRKEKVKLVIKNGSPISFENSGDGKTYFSNLYPLFDSNGKVNRIAVYSKDITSEKQAEIEKQTYTENLAIINEINEGVNQGLPLRQITGLIDKKLKEILPISAVAYYLTSKDGKFLQTTSFSLPPELESQLVKMIGRSIPMVEIPITPNGVYSQALKKQKGSIATDPNFLIDRIKEIIDSDKNSRRPKIILKKIIPIVTRLMGTKSIISLPLVDKGKTIGLLEVSSQTILTEKDLQRLEMISGQLTSAIIRKQAEENLKYSNERFTELAGNIPDMFWEYDRTRDRLIYASPAFEMIWGRKVEELLENTQVFLDSVIPDDLPMVEKAHQMEARGELTDLEYRVVDMKGKLHWVKERSYPIFDETGKLIRTVGLDRDFTDSKDAELRIKESESFLQSIVQSSPSDIFTVSPEGYFLYTNKPWPGETEEEFLSIKFIDEVHPSQVDLAAQLFHKAIETKTIQEAELQKKTSTGEYRWLQVMFSPVIVDNQIKRVTIFTFDIHERKLAEAALRKSEETQHALMEAISESVLLVNTDGTGVIANKTALTRLNLSKEQFVGQYVFRSLQPDIGSERRKYLDLAIKTGEPVRFEDVRFNRNIINNFNPILDIDGSVLQVAMIGFDVTELKRAQEDLLASEHRNKAIVDAIPDLLYRVSQDGTFLDSKINPNDRMYIPSEKLLGKKIPDVLSTIAAEQSMEAIKKAFIEKDLQTVVFNLGRGQNTRTYEARVSPNVDENEAVIIMRDITDQKRMEEDIRKSEEKYRRLSEELEQRVNERTAEYQDLYDNAPTGYHSLDNTGTIQMINETECRMLGYTRAELIGKKVFEMLIPESQQVFFENFPDFKKHGFLHNLELNFLRKDGSVMPTIVNATAIYDKDGNYQLSRTTVVDNTERKAIEAEIKRVNNLADTALALSKAGYWYVPLDGSGEYISSERVVAIQGDAYHPDFHYDLNQDWLRNVQLANPVMAKLTNQAFTETLNGKSDRYDAEYPYRRPVDNQIIWLHAVGNIVRDENGKPIGMVGVSQDITQRKLMEQELNKAKEEAEKANKAKSVFLANMSHEIRTPMNAILGFAQILLKDQDLQPKNRNYVEIINRSGEHLLSLINEILEMSKIEAGHVAINPVTFNLPAMINDICSMFSPRLEAKNLTISTDLTPTLNTFIIADANKVKEILINLVGNAIKFTEKGGITIRCAAQRDTTRDDPKALTLSIDVEDTGVGILRDDVETLFQAFEQTSSGAQLIGGTGLGLAISQNHARLMGGNITVTSTPGKGSCFHVKLAVLEGEEIEPSTAYVERHVTGLIPGTGEVKVLIVDDHEENRMVIQEFLEPIGVKVMNAENGEKAIAITEFWKPDLIFMDLRMPVMNGYEASRRIKALELGKKIQIVALTASILEMDKQKVINSGMNGYIRKPFKEYELFAMLEDKLGKIFTYSDQAIVKKNVKPIEEVRLTTKVLKVLPKELIESMITATTNAQFDTLLDLIDQVSTYSPEMAGKLRGMANNFQYDALLKLFKGGQSNGN